MSNIFVLTLFVLKVKLGSAIQHEKKKYEKKIGYCPGLEPGTFGLPGHCTELTKTDIYGSGWHINKH